MESESSEQDGNQKQDEPADDQPSKNSQPESDTQDSTAPGFIVVNQSGQLITAAELSSAISQQMQMYALGNRLPVVLPTMKSPIKQEFDASADPGHSKDCTVLPPPAKIPRVIRPKLHVKEKKSVENSSELEDSLQTVLDEVQSGILSRLDGFGKRVEDISMKCQSLEEKINSIAAQIKENGSVSRVALSTTAKRPSSIIVGLQKTPKKEKGMEEITATVIETKEAAAAAAIAAEEARAKSKPSNREEDFPNGSWLGDPNDEEKRVRCHITELDLIKINQTSRSPEKLALTLLDHLFDRETQAQSNLSGNSRYNKRQLDPWKIFGLKCHLDFRFGVEEVDWHRIKQNLDSKCRTAFRRKQKGLDLSVKAFTKNAANNDLVSGKATEKILYPSENCHPPDTLQDFSMSGSELGMHGAVPVALHTSDGLFSLPVGLGTEALERGQLQVIHATPEQIAQFQQSHQIQIFTSPQVTNEILETEDEENEDDEDGSETT